MKVPVIMGPMNGGMHYPPGFLHLQSGFERFAVSAGRRLSEFMNRLMPGKRRAALLLVANERTRSALPRGVCANVKVLVENGVDLTLWRGPEKAKEVSETTRFVFMGRLIELKAVDLLLLAFHRASRQTSIRLSIIGDGAERTKLEGIARTLEIFDDLGEQPGKVRFLGWMSQIECAGRLANSDALVLPSMAECGGAVVLEAMAMEVPVIATAWGGPLDYLDASCGILINPSSKESFVDDLTQALIRLATHPQDRRDMGRAGRVKVIKEFDWDTKVDQMLHHYRTCIGTESRSDLATEH
jgi:glycosyltransferase involved in cell wall biosynthesis